MIKFHFMAVSAIFLGLQPKFGTNTISESDLILETAIQDQLNTSAKIREYLASVQAGIGSTTTANKPCTRVESVVWCRERRPYLPTTLATDDMKMRREGQFPTGYAEEDTEGERKIGWSKEADLAEQRNCVPLAPELGRWRPFHYQPYGVKRLRLLAAILRYDLCLSGCSVISNQDIRPLIKGNRYWEATHGTMPFLRPVARSVFVITPVRYVAVLFGNLVTLLWFLHQHVSERRGSTLPPNEQQQQQVICHRWNARHGIYLFEIGFALCHLAVLHLDTGFVYVRHLFLFTFVPCWLYRGTVRWQFLEFCTDFISPCFLIGFLVKTWWQIGGKKEGGEVHATEHGAETEDKQNTGNAAPGGQTKNRKTLFLVLVGSFALSLFLYVGCAVTLDTVTGPPYVLREDFKDYIPKMVKNGEEPPPNIAIQIHYEEMSGLFGIFGVRTISRTENCRMGKCEAKTFESFISQTLDQYFINLQNFTNLLDNPLHVQQQSFCYGVMQNATLALYQPPSDTFQGLKVRRVTNVGKRFGLLDLRLPCPYETLDVENTSLTMEIPPRTTAVYISLLIVQLLTLIGFAGLVQYHFGRRFSSQNAWKDILIATGKKEKPVLQRQSATKRQQEIEKDDPKVNEERKWRRQYPIIYRRCVQWQVVVQIVTLVSLLVLELEQTGARYCTTFCTDIFKGCDKEIPRICNWAYKKDRPETPHRYVPLDKYGMSFRTVADTIRFLNAMSAWFMLMFRCLSFNKFNLKLGFIRVWQPRDGDEDMNDGDEAP